MYGKMKRTLALVLALSILVSLFSMTVSAQEVSGVLTLDAVQEAVITQGQTAYLSFTPEQDGVYLFTAEASVDSYATLYDADMNELAQDDDSGSERNFQTGCKLIAGNTYYLGVNCWSGESATIPVRVTESPVADVQAQPISIIENTDGYLANGWNDQTQSNQEYYHYSWYNRLSYTVTYTDGSTQQVSGTGFNYNGEWQSVSWQDGQGATAPWTAGNTYTPTISVMGYSAQVSVTVTESPVASVTAQPVSIMEGTNGYLTSGWNENTQANEDYYYYNWYTGLSYTVTFTDGSTQQADGGGFYYNGEWQSISCSSGQSATAPWTVGNTYTPTFRVMGYTAQAEVTITPSPVQSIEVEPILMAQNKGGYWSEHWSEGVSTSYYRYYWWENMVTTVTFTDGSTQKVTGTGFYYGDNWFSVSYQDDQGIDNQLQAGNTYYFDVSCMGATTQAEVTIGATVQSNGFEYVTQNGNAIISDCTKTDTVLQIPETLDGYTVTGIVSLGEAVEYVEELVIPDSVSMLSSQAIAPWGNVLKKLTVGAGLTSFSANVLEYAEELEEITVAAGNPNYCSVDGVVYDKAVTKLIAYPKAKTTTHVIPDSVTDIDGLFSDNYLFTGANVRTGAGTPEYVTVDGVVYNKEMTKVYSCAVEKTGSYEMPSTVTEIGNYAFAKTNLEEVTIAPGVTQIAYGAFYKNSALEKISIPESVTVIDIMAFADCDGLEQVHIEDVAAWCETIFYSNPLMIAKDLYLNGELVKELVIPNVVETVYGTAFRNSSITSVTVPSSVKSIGYSAFKGSAVETITIAEGLEWIGEEAFAESALKAVDLPDSLTDMAGEVFADCEQLKELTIGKGLHSIYWRTFANTGLISIVIPENVQSIYENAFAGSALEHVVFENDEIEIWNKAFYQCPLEEIELGENVSTIGERAFVGNKAVTLKIPDSVTYVSYRCFDSSEYLISVTVPETVEEINSYAFDNSYNISHVYYEGTQTQWEDLKANSPQLQAAKVHYEVQGEACTVNRTCTQIEHYCQICKEWDYIVYDTPRHQLVNGVCSVCGYGAQVKDGWQKEDGKWCYYENGTKVKSDWRRDGNAWCYLDDKGYMVTDQWMKDSTGWCYLGSDGKMKTNAWVRDEKGWCYVGNKGYCVTNQWKQDGSGNWFYLDSNGQMLTNEWMKDTQGWCYLGADGKMVKNRWVKDSAGWCYLGANGRMVTNQWVQDSQGWCYLGANGYAATNCWMKDSKGWCYLDQNGRMATNTWVRDSAGWCYLGANGYCVTNQWMKDSTGWCYLGGNGSMKKNAWIQDGNKWYYVDGNGYMVTGNRNIGGKTYRFNSSGVWVG